MSEKQTDKKTDESISLMDAATALGMIKDAIRREEEKLKEIANAEEQDPVLIEGETSEGYICHLMVDPKDAARIMLEYRYPIWSILMEDAPDAMWRELARKYGIAVVSSVDL